jgi:hypothetical protein
MKRGVSFESEIDSILESSLIADIQKSKLKENTSNTNPSKSTKISAAQGTLPTKSNISKPKAAAAAREDEYSYDFEDEDFNIPLP